MSKGALIFALNSGFDYQSIAAVAAERIRRYLNVPVSIITNQELPEKFANLFDSVILISEKDSQIRTINDGNNSTQINWLNFSRFSAYDLTPYDETLVIDADYIINTDCLKYCFNSDKDFLIYRTGVDVSPWRDGKEFKVLNEFSIPFYWATVFYFKKTNLNRIFFNLVQYIKDNWDYYRLVYQIVEKKFRNDYAFSIAINLLHVGMISNKFGLIPGKMFYSLDKDVIIELSKDFCKIMYPKQNSSTEYVPAKITQDIHLMNKHSLLRMSL